MHHLIVLTQVVQQVLYFTARFVDIDQYNYCNNVKAIRHIRCERQHVPHVQKQSS
jgi:hypothetical protein